MGDLARIIRVKLVENSLEFLFRHVVPDVDSRWEEVTVVYLPVAVIVDFRNYVIELIYVDLDPLIRKNLRELVKIDHPGASRIDGFKLGSQIFDFFLRDHLNKHVHGCTL